MSDRIMKKRIKKNDDPITKEQREYWVNEFKKLIQEIEEKIERIKNENNR